jgi:hypothetical protein
MTYPVQKVKEQQDLVLAKDLKMQKFKLEVSTYIEIIILSSLNYLISKIFITLRIS